MKVSMYVGYTLLAIVVVAILVGIVAFTTTPKPQPSPQQCPNVLLKKGNRLLLINTQKPTVDGINPMYFNNLEDYVSYAKQQNTINNKTPLQSCPLLFLQQDDEKTQDDDPTVTQTQTQDDETQDDDPAEEEDVNKVLLVANNNHHAAPMADFKPMPTIQVPPLPKALPNPVPPQKVSFPHPPSVMQPYIPPTVGLPSTSSSQNVAQIAGPIPTFAQRKPAPYVDAARDDAPFNQNLYPGFDPMNLYAGVYTTIDEVHYSTRQPQSGTPFSDNAMDPNWGGVQFTRAAVNSGKYDENMVETTLYSSPPNTFMIPSMRPLVDPAAAPATQAPLTSLLPA